MENQHTHIGRNLKPEHDNLHSFCIYPNEKIEAQRSDEVIILRLRQHPLTQLPWVLNIVFLIIIIAILNIFIPGFATVGQIIVFNAFSVTFIFSYGWVNFLLWYFNVGVVTNARLLDIDFHNLLYKEVTASNIDKVADVTAKVGGFFGSIFQYGNVFVKTEGGDTQNVEFENVPRPSDVVHIINDLVVSSSQ